MARKCRHQWEWRKGSIGINGLVLIETWRCLRCSVAAITVNDAERTKRNMAEILGEEILAVGGTVIVSHVSQINFRTSMEPNL